MDQAEFFKVDFRTKQTIHIVSFSKVCYNFNIQEMSRYEFKNIIVL